jgi:hypothetical protein
MKRQGFEKPGTYTTGPGYTRSERRSTGAASGPESKEPTAEKLRLPRLLLEERFHPSFTCKDIHQALTEYFEEDTTKYHR